MGNALPVLVTRSKHSGLDAYQATLALVRHDPEREQLQRILLDVTRGADRDLAQLAVTCLGHVGRIDREVLAWELAEPAPGVAPRRSFGQRPA